MRKIILVLGIFCFFREGYALTTPQAGFFYYSLIPHVPNIYFSYFSEDLDIPAENSAFFKLERKNSQSDTDHIHFVDWTNLQYFFSIQKLLHFGPQDDFIFKPDILEKNQKKDIREQVYRDLLTLTIDNGLTVKRLSFLSPMFRSLFFSQLYDKDFIRALSSSSHIRLFCLFPLRGPGGFIDLLVQSQYYSEDKDVKSVDTGPYIPQSYKTLVIDARGLSIIPALFPSIYTKDASGKLQLLYSFPQSNKRAIIKNGYVRYLTDEKALVKHRKNFYTAALRTYGESKTDVIISRDSYLKFFSSKESIQNLRDGGFIIIVNPQIMANKGR